MDLDIRAQGFLEGGGGRWQDTFFDVRVFNLHARSYCQTSLGVCYCKHKKEKWRNYEESVQNVEHGSFVPLVFSVTGGMGIAARIFYKCLTSLISQKNGQSYATMLVWMTCSISLTLTCLTVMCLWGLQSNRPPPPHWRYPTACRFSVSGGLGT